MKRKIKDYYREQFDYHDSDVVGYIVGGALVVDEPTDEEKELYDGDWSIVTQADVWSMVHNSSDKQAVVFWQGFKKFTAYYPTRDSSEFRVIEVELID